MEKENDGTGIQLLSLSRQGLKIHKNQSHQMLPRETEKRRKKSQIKGNH